MMRHALLGLAASALLMVTPGASSDGGPNAGKRPGPALPELPQVTADAQTAREISGRLHDLETKTEHRRYHAANVLSGMGPAAAPGLVRLFDHSDPAVRGHAAAALGWMASIEGKKGNEPFARLLIPYVATGLGDDDPSVRRWAAEVLGKNGRRAKAVIPRLREAEADPHEAVRKTAAEALERIRASLDAAEVE